MGAHHIILRTLRKFLKDEILTEEQRYAAETLLERLADLKETPTGEKLTAQQIRQIVSQADIDQVWKAIEQRHYNQLFEISNRGIRTDIDTNIAVACTALVAWELNLRIANRRRDSIDG